MLLLSLQYMGGLCHAATPASLTPPITPMYFLWHIVLILNKYPYSFAEMEVSCPFFSILIFVFPFPSK
jgi:hypothetical protein